MLDAVEGCEDAVLEEAPHLMVEDGVVLLQREHVVRVLPDDVGCDGLLASHRVDGDDAPCEVQDSQQLRDGRDLIGLVARPNLPEDQLVGRRPGIDEVDGAAIPGTVHTAASRLAIDGDDLTLDALDDGADPRHEAARERLRVQQ